MESDRDSESHEEGVDTDAAVRFAQVYSDNKHFLRAYIYNAIPNTDAIDEILQRAAVVMWRKFSDLRDDRDFLKWAYRVTRYEILIYRRSMARNKLMFDTDLLQSMSEEYESDAEFMKERMEAFNKCFASLSDAEQKLAKRVFMDHCRIKNVAVEFGEEVKRFYKTVGRLRLKLLKCIEKRLESGNDARLQ